MANYTKEVLKVQPYFDMEAVMALLQETRLGGQVLEDMVHTFERVAKELNSVVLKTEKGDYLVVWLNEKAEQEADELFAKDPEKGFRFNCIGQSIIMNAVYQILPEVEQAGCAPCPVPNESIAEALKAENIPYLDGEPTLVRRFSVLTSLPFRGACEICYLREACPKANGQSDNFHSVELPGYQE
ncbi:hypothetical protein JBF11_08425 [Taurinivorans muris]|jgi:hypothetical protein|uniref:Uncharacterized protein n=1 Tax=Taurinivorans muris TaxID=2787751 RepID=A0ABY5Y0Y2_9BACT|nr:hypothetical protein [Mailhella sp.]UWX05461.1 hypothetical protein JBF11_08425 [Desulfovibrionaceae bacterium LT0009]HBV42336.1 hypothetical protein [Desulfovibrio sp.]